MIPDNLKSLYLSELQEACSFEAQISKALPTFADKASNSALRKFLSADVPAARMRGERLCGLLEIHDVADESHKDGSMQAILREALEWAGAIEDPTVRDAAMIASFQRILHYGLAVHGSLAEWAKQLDLADRETLHDGLEETRRADTQLTDIAQQMVNKAA